MKSDGVNFGTWYKCADGKLHYFLGAKPLCGTASEPEREVSGAISSGPTFPGQTPCNRCRIANANRWAGAEVRTG